MATPSRRWSGEWGRPHGPAAPDVDVLIPTAGRTTELALTLAGLAAQDDPAFRVIVSDQSDDGAAARDPGVRAMLRILEAQGRPTRLLRNLPRRGLAAQRQFLLDASAAASVLFLDDDVWLEPGLLARLHTALTTLRCGFVGSAVQGLSYLGDVRPHETAAFEPWGNGVLPERVRRGEPAFERWPLHNAANLVHLAADLDVARDGWLAYRIAWVGACVLYRRAALVASGGFDFWEQLPADHAGEDVAAEWRVMETYGGAGILPSGAVHLEAPTTIERRDVDAFDVVFDEDAATRPVDDRQEEERGRAMPTPIEIQKFLGGLDYPAVKDDILAKAESEGADDAVLDALRGIPDGEYDAPTAISKAVSN